MLGIVERLARGGDGRRYVDGGIRSLSNADAAAGYDRVVILAPTVISDPVRAHIDAESARRRARVLGRAWLPVG